MYCPTEECEVQIEDRKDCIEYLCPNKCDFRQCPTRVRQDSHCFTILNCSAKPPTLGEHYIMISLICLTILAIFLIGLYLGKSLITRNLVLNGRLKIVLRDRKFSKINTSGIECRRTQTYYRAFVGRCERVSLSPHVTS